MRAPIVSRIPLNMAFKDNSIMDSKIESKRPAVSPKSNPSRVFPSPSRRLPSIKNLPPLIGFGLLNITLTRTGLAFATYAGSINQNALIMSGLKMP